MAKKPRESTVIAIRLANSVVAKLAEAAEGTGMTVTQYLKLSAVSLSGNQKEQIQSVYKAMRNEQAKLVMLTSQLKDIQRAREELEFAVERNAG